MIDFRKHLDETGSVLSFFGTTAVLAWSNRAVKTSPGDLVSCFTRDTDVLTRVFIPQVQQTERTQPVARIHTITAHS